MPGGYQQADRRGGPPPDHRIEPGLTARDIAGTEDDRRETVAAGQFGRPAGHQFQRLQGGDCCKLW